MAMKVILLIFCWLISQTKARVPFLTDECQSLTELKTDADSCCTLPRPSYSPENEVNCRDECSKITGPRRCCIRRCRIARLGIWKNETFHKEALKELLLGDPGTNEIWGETVKHAVDNCTEKFLTNNFDSQISCIPSFVQYIYFCVSSEMFVNCPRMSITDDCDRVRMKAIECMKSEPTFQFPAYYYKWRFSTKKSKIENDKGSNDIENNNPEDD